MTRRSSNLVKIILDSKTLSVSSDRTILEVAEEQGLDIPTLCHDPRLEPYGSCWICLVKVVGAKGFVPACATKVRDGMEIVTLDEDIRSARKMALELLLSNHYGDCKPPCTLACPSNIDVQGYVGLIANGKYREALALIKKDNPFPSVCGRVCPRPCETDCRRNLVDEPVGIDWLKRYVADLDLFSEDSYDPVLTKPTGKKVAVVGAGPAGLSAAYYLAQSGIQVTVFEAQEKAGGMLRYGIPDYRLPQEVLDLEIGTILRLGVELKTGVRLGTDIRLQALQQDYDAVILSCGAWSGRAMRIEGENLPDVLQGIGFLNRVARGEQVALGRRVAVIGGGNTAIDAARVSLRLGAEKVHIFYRRTRQEMPASEMEIHEAEEEGVLIDYLVAPTGIEGDDQGIQGITLIRMELGEPDDSGRRRPIPVSGSEFTEEIDTIITAIGQYTDLGFIVEEELLDERGYLRCDSETGETTLAGIFAAGDLVTGPDIAIRAIAGGKGVARSATDFLEKKEIRRPDEFLIKKEELAPVTPEDLQDEEKIPRQQMAVVSPQKRIESFQEIEAGYSEQQALQEAARCLECGCQDVHECKLKAYSQQYQAVTQHFLGEAQKHPIDESHLFITRDPSKCVLCGRCIRICLDVQGLGVLGYMNRGFASQVIPSFDMPFGDDALCISCGQCVSACPVGALTEKQADGKTVPLPERGESGICSLCSVGCPLEYRYHGTLLTRVKERVVDGTNGTLCQKGKFEHFFLNVPILEQIRNREGTQINRTEAQKLLKHSLKQSERPLLRISPYLAGEAIDTFLHWAAEQGVAVEAAGLSGSPEGIAEGWQTFLSASIPSDSESPFFEDLSIENRIVLIIGDLEQSNNVAYTDCLRMKRSGLDLRLLDLESSGPELGVMLNDVFAEAKADRVDVLLNPEDLRQKLGRAAEQAVCQTLQSVADRVRVTLFWNARNSGYLLGRLGGRKGTQAGRPDLILEAGGENNDSGSDSGIKTIYWGTLPPQNTPLLSVPMAHALWIGGTTYRSGRSPVSAGPLEEKLVQNLLL